MSLNLVFLGAPGAGKGTQARMLSQKQEIVYIATGDIFRQEIENKTPNGVAAAEYLKTGQLVPDDIVIKIVKDRILKRDCQENGFLFDGFPRTLNQAEFLEEILMKMKKKIQFVIHLRMSPEVLIKRLSSRRYCQDCKLVFNLVSNPPPDPEKCRCGGKLSRREDDSSETIKKRLKVYEDQTKPLLSYYQSGGLLKAIDGSQPIDKVFSDICDAVAVNQGSSV